ncbi:MAG: low molecular weight protein arginine phosphatase [Gammaproteobacteria bacterium]|nr:low molecular weight protein arginine phosphatase [Gammaproteobacteria bacterium]
MQDKTILFICSGNTCRSQMAEALAWQLCEQGVFISAGTRAAAQQPTSSHALTLLRERGIDWRGVSQRLTPEVLNQSDLVLVMTHEQQQLVEQMLAETNCQHISVELLSADAEIADPYGEDLACYRRCMQSLEAALNYRFRF